MKTSAAYFKFEIPVRTRVVGDVPEGTKVDLEYLPDGAKLTSLQKEKEKAPPPKLALLSGQDWITISDDGVADFSGRATFAILDDKGKPRLVIGLRITGRADLCTAHAPGQPAQPRSGKHAYECWQSGFGDGWELPLALPVTFEVAEDPANGWAGLARALFVACGKVIYGPGRNSPIQQLSFELLKVEPS